MCFFTDLRRKSFQTSSLNSLRKYLMFEFDQTYSISFLFSFICLNLSVIDLCYYRQSMCGQGCTSRTHNAKNVQDSFRNLNFNYVAATSSLIQLESLGGFDVLYKISFAELDFPSLSPALKMLREITVRTNLEIRERLFFSKVSINYVSKYS